MVNFLIVVGIIFLVLCLFSSVIVLSAVLNNRKFRNRQVIKDYDIDAIENSQNEDELLEH